MVSTSTIQTYQDNDISFRYMLILVFLPILYVSSVLCVAYILHKYFQLGPWSSIVISILITPSGITPINMLIALTDV